MSGTAIVAEGSKHGIAGEIVGVERAQTRGTGGVADEVDPANGIQASIYVGASRSGVVGDDGVFQSDS